MATWDSDYLLSYLNRQLGRGSNDAITPAVKYQMLSEAQNQVIADLAAICPHVLYPTAPYASLPTLTTTDQQIYTFGTDSNGFANFPIGKGGIYASLDDIPDYPLRENWDYMNEGTQIRALNNGTLPGTLYWYGIAQPVDIDATHQPALNPESARELIGIRAAYNFGTEGNRNPELAATMATKYGTPLSVNRPGRFDFWCLTWKTQFRGGGAISYTGLQLALGGAYNTLMT